MKPTKHELLFAAGVSIYIVVFIIVFQPFESGRSPFEIILISSLLISVIHFLLYITIYNYTKKTFKKIRNDLGRDVFRSILFIIIVGIVSKSTHWIIGLSSSNGFPYWVYATLWVLSIPYGIRLFFNYKRSIASQETGKEENTSVPLFKDTEDFPEFLSTLTPDNLYYMKAEGNYTSVVWDNNGSLEHKLFRGTLKFFESKIIDKNVKRCHRSYIINTSKIKNIKGNSRGYKTILKINNETHEIPISPDYRKTIVVR